MEATCERALAMGLPAVAFTEHLDHTEWMIRAEDLRQSDHLQKFVTSAGSIVPGRFDVEGYLESVHTCRERFPSLRIMTGLELGEPHWHGEAVHAVLSSGQFERVLGSLHCLPLGERFSEPPYLYGERQPAQVLRDYLAEVPRLVKGCDAFEVLAHIDYPIRYWPTELGPFECEPFEDEFRHALRALADSDRALEINTRSELQPEIVRWWREEGGRAVTFGSDAHDPGRLGDGFGQATAMAESHGFRAGRHPWDFWVRSI
jgi:histidinol-phosphatase (PHP family)